ncbi:Rho GTPase activation protein [Hortaea werneckii]|nr:Rho GTPase activation protein [Hortaea werneckii]
MPRHGKPAELTINLKSATDTSHTTSRPKSSPIEVDLSSFGGDLGSPQQDYPAAKAPSSSPSNSPRHNRDPSKNFLSNFKSKKAPEQELDQHRTQVRRTKEGDDEYRPGSSSMSKVYHLRNNPGSTPELSLVGSADNVSKNGDDPNSSRPQPSPHYSEDSIASKRRENKPFRNPLARRPSLRRDSASRGSKPELKASFEKPPNTAPIQSQNPRNEETMFKSKGKESRGKSAERALASKSSENLTEARSLKATQSKEKSGFMSGSKNAMSKATKGGGNLLTRLGKIGRSSSHNEKDVSDADYKIKVINLPLVEQTRITRISKDLGSCRDKTEFWMPSLPWRCIDYLNLNCESEGLYRVPGSGPQVKHWQRRFDSEFDVDLLDEQDLYDPNTIGSMFKSWLRDLPTEIMPANVQASLAAELEKDNPDYSKMGQPAPQKLRDALSDLPPFNYYLLFAITCHLSLLLSHKEKNKMDLNNLSICIGPPLKLERWLFNYLVGDWRHCWQGCFTEKQYLDAEKAHEQGVEYPSSRGAESLSTTSSHNANADDLRPTNSSGSGSNASQYEDARPSQTTGAGSQAKQDAKPDTYRPTAVRQASSGSISTAKQRGSPSIAETKRPSTAETKKGREVSNTRTLAPRKASHGRSKSDIPTTPVKLSHSSVDQQFPLPGQS